MGLREDCVKVLNEIIAEAESTEMIEIDINDLAKLLNGCQMHIDFDKEIKHIIIKFKEEK